YSCSGSHVLNGGRLRPGLRRLERIAEEVGSRSCKFREGDVLERVLDGVVDFLPIAAHATTGQEITIALAMFHAFGKRDGAVDGADDVADRDFLRRAGEREAAVETAMGIEDAGARHG